MIISCPQCGTQYNLPDSSVRHGAKARCAQCKTIFVLHVQVQPQARQVAQGQGVAPQAVQQQNVHVAPQQNVHVAPQQNVQVAPQQAPQIAQPDTPQAQSPIMADGLPPLAPPPQSASVPFVGGPSFMQGPAFAQPASRSGPTSVPTSVPTSGASIPQQEMLSTEPQPQSQSPNSFNPSDLATLTGQANLARRPSHGESRQQASSQSESARPRSESTPFQSFMTGLLLLVIFGMLGFGAWRYMPRLGNDQLEAEADRIALLRAEIKDIALHNVHQYTVKSNKAGLLLVLEGRIINNFRSPREMVKVEAALYDAEGNQLEDSQQLCGVLVSKLQMQIWDASEIEAALDNELEAYAHNVNIASGTSVPFMAVFVDPPSSVASYSVRVVDAQISPSKNAVQ